MIVYMVIPWPEFRMPTEYSTSLNAWHRDIDAMKKTGVLYEVGFMELEELLHKKDQHTVELEDLVKKLVTWFTDHTSATFPFLQTGELGLIPEDSPDMATRIDMIKSRMDDRNVL